MVSSTLTNFVWGGISQHVTNISNLYLASKWNALSDNLSNLEVSSSINELFFYQSVIVYLFNGLVAFTVIIGVVFYSLSYGAKLMSNVSSSFDVYLVSFNYFSDLEEEMGSADDALFYFLVFGLVITWFFFFTLFSAYISGSISWIISLLLIVALTAIIIPSFVLKNFGLAAPMYVRGSGRTTSLAFEAMLDFVSISVIMIRFLIQNIRFVFIFSAFFELYEFVYDKLYLDFSLTLTNNILITPQVSSMYWYELAGHFILQWILYLYYLGHLTLLFIAQLSIYFALSFWLFFFLYTTFTLENHEKYFLVQRLNK